MDRARLEELKAMAPRDYLLTPEWKAKRRQALKFQGNHCQVCRSTNGLNVHHNTYERVGEESMDDLAVLCRSCHRIYHANGKLASSQNRRACKFRLRKISKAALYRKYVELHPMDLIDRFEHIEKDLSNPNYSEPCSLIVDLHEDLQRVVAEKHPSLHAKHLALFARLLSEVRRHCDCGENTRWKHTEPWWEDR